MKISEVEVGKQYGALDSPQSRYGVDPRQVKVLEIVTEQERVYVGRYLSGGSQRTRNVRRVKVEVLDGSTVKNHVGWRRDKIRQATKGETLVIEARQLVGEWSLLRGDILKRQQEEQARINLEERTRERLLAVGFKPKDISWGAVGIRARDSKRIELEFNNEYAEKLLAMLEAK